MEKVNYNLDEETRNIILELYKKAKELNLGNLNFEYYGTGKTQEVNFRLAEYRTHWELLVIYDNQTDVYKIKDDKGIHYETTEKH